MLSLRIWDFIVLRFLVWYFIGNRGGGGGGGGGGGSI